VFQPSSTDTATSQAVTSKLSREDETFVTELQSTYKVQDKAVIIKAVELLRSLDQSVVEALSQVDACVIRRSMAGNTDAERLGERVLRRLTDFVVKTRGKTPSSSSSGKNPTLLGTGPSRGEAEKRRADAVSSGGGGGRPPEKVPRITPGSSVSRAATGFNRAQRPDTQPLFGSRVYRDEPGQADWMRPPTRSGLMRAGFRMSGYRPPARGGYGRSPYF